MTVARGARGSRRAATSAAGRGDPLWYKDAIIYELHVRAFFDSDGNGIGDFRGLAAKLDYLADLGVTALWLLPFYPSPLRDDGYDIADYRRVHPAYGTMSDVRRFIRAAHERGLRVITELVCNHTSDQHPWFQRARRAPAGSPWRDFYVWSDTPDRYREARIIFKDFETSNWAWDPVAGAYYWHRFYSHQPDLNFDNPRVREAIKRVIDFWLDLGVDGLRLDAVPYLIEREGTNGENLPETHEVLRELRAHIDERYGDRMLLAEANQWPEEAAAYFGDGDECNMAFHFPVMPRMFMAIRMEDRSPIVDILAQTPAIPETAQWALFLRNHDELTLEMVTDEERDYMYRSYASDPQARINLGIRRRLAPLLGNNRRRIELMNGLLFSLPGTPVVYYGDEIGMGDNVYLGDRNGVRTPMQWSGDRNAGFSTTNSQRLYMPPIVDSEYHYQSVNVEAQLANPHSLLWWMRRLIALRRRHPAFGRGSMELVDGENRKILAFLRSHGDETVLVVANLSRYVQWTRLELSACEGMVPVEMFGSVEFPRITGEPYFVSLGPHSFLWLELRTGREPLPEALPILERPGSLGELFAPARSGELDATLLRWLPDRRWYRGRTRRIRSLGTVDRIPFRADDREVLLAVVEVTYTEGDPDRYLVVLAIDDRMAAEDRAVIAELERDGQPAGRLVDAAADPDVGRRLLELVRGRHRVRGTTGELVGRPAKAIASMVPPKGTSAVVRAFRGEQSNTSLVIDDTSILKLYRLIEPGENPDVEMGRFLSERGFAHVPRVGGWIEYRRPGEPVASAAMLQAFVPNEGDLWDVARASVDGFLDVAVASGVDAPAVGSGIRDLLALAGQEPDDTAVSLVGPFADTAALLGRRTGEFHLVMVEASDDPDFAPEPFTGYQQRSLYQSIRALGADVGRMVGRERDRIPEHLRADVGALRDLPGAIDRSLEPFLRTKIGGLRIRCHGDLHAGQVLVSGNDVVITDLEGEPLRALSERRLKRPALTDVAGMIRSFHYAAHGALIGRGDRGAGDLGRWADLWYASVAAAYLRAYLETVAGTDLVPSDPDALATLLEALVLQKAIYEVRYELSSRPDWLAIPLRGVADALRT